MENRRSVLTAASALTSLGDHSSSEASQQLPTGSSQPKTTPNGQHLTISDTRKLNDSENRDQRLGGDASSAGSTLGTRPQEDVPMTFPQRLMEILSKEDDSDIITWLPHGKGFIIYQKKKFASQIMPKYFKHSKFTSFTRKLNRWGFTRITRGPETGAYYHKFFQKNNPRLCVQMCCQSIKPATPGELWSPTPLSQTASQLSMSTAFSRLNLSNDRPSLTGRVFGSSSSANRATTNTPIPNYSMPVSATQHVPGASSSSLLRLRQLQQQQQQLLLQQRQVMALSAVPKQHSRYSAPSVTAPLPSSCNAVNHSTNAAATPSATLSQGTSGNPATSDHSSAVISAAISALQRSNTTAYVSMLMAQEKAHVQMTASSSVRGTEQSTAAHQVPSAFQFQQQQSKFLQAQRMQLSKYTQQRMLAAAAGQAAALEGASQEIQSICTGTTSQALPTAPQQQRSAAAKGAGTKGKRYPQGAKRASAA